MFLPALIGSLTRHLLTALGGALVTIGVIQGSPESFVAANTPVVTGLLMYLASQLWSLLQKKQVINLSGTKW